MIELIAAALIHFASLTIPVPTNDVQSEAPKQTTTTTTTNNDGNPGGTGTWDDNG